MSEDHAATILLAEDDRSVRDSLVRALGFVGYTVHATANGAELLDQVESVQPDCILLDLMMPGVDGLTACERLRKRGVRTPILMLTARHEVRDRVAGLDAGADDYLVKPFDLDELYARVRALLRRVDVPDDAATLELGSLRLDPRSRTASRAGAELDLTKTEFDLLELLLLNAGIVLSREVIYERIWGYDFETTSKSLDVYVGYLRRKTEADDPDRIIHTIRGVGYVARQP